MKKAVAAIFLLSICICFSACRKTDTTPGGAHTYQPPMDTIYLYQDSYDLRLPEYKIDLKDKTFWKFTAESFDDDPRDASGENEGFTFVCDLSDEKIEQFILESSRYGFTNWDEDYDDLDIMDGLQWSITIHFQDGTKKRISGSNAFPETWNAMRDAFAALTGTDVWK